ncbi:S1C family serine protease [Massilia sp. TS11]|uniref:S1C family serine protease n=1 Tax=Massilia sp. TS11 TaxID=2908003 RepID=UPI001EDB6E91|nr:trypsin-like peptidase domain-containing protein [Massilia sp. TS11]MCG2586261.1 trypsin-like peptidase domain-containing protein [Massilia sp. TS11]
MILRSLLLACCLALPVLSPAFAADADDASVQAPTRLDASVVKILSSLRPPNHFQPWNKSNTQEISGSGVIIEGKRILTNAHVVNYASQIQVQGHQGGDKYPARVVAIARGMDLALLKLDDESFFDKRPPMPRADKLPAVRDAVFAMGFPMSVNSLSITKGIVSRVEFTNLGAGVSGLRLQVDAAINPGNSGGPAVADNKMIGIAYATQGNAQNIGYIIPNAEIDLFLADVADGRYDGKPALWDVFQALESPALRSFLQVGREVQGVVVHKPYRTDADYPLKEMDVVTHIGDTPIDNQGMIALDANTRVIFRYRVQQIARNGKVPLTVLRGGKTLKVEVPVTSERPALITDLKGEYPSYFIYGPIVFGRATTEFLNNLSGSQSWWQLSTYDASPLVTRRMAMPDANRQELVVVCSSFFPHKLVRGYGNRFTSVVYSINEVPVKSLRHLVELLRDAKDEMIVIRFDQREGETIVLPRREVLASTDAILAENGIRAQASADMLAVWQAKAAAGR